MNRSSWANRVLMPAATRPAAGASAGGDPLWDNVALMSNDMTTDAKNGRTLTIQGSGAALSGSGKFGGTCISAWGYNPTRANECIWSSPSSNPTLGFNGDEDWTFEFFARGWQWTDTTQKQALLLHVGYGAGNEFKIFFGRSASNGAQVQATMSSNSSVVWNSGAVNVDEFKDTWKHVHLSRSGDTVFLGYEGALLAQSTSASIGNMYTISGGTTGFVRIGDASVMAAQSIGWMVGNFRYTKLAARYPISAYTVPTAAFPQS